MEGKFGNRAEAAHHGQQVFLIWGGNGWIAGLLFDLLTTQDKEVYRTTIPMQNREAVIKELDQINPTHVLNCAGVTGRPNVDWCEDNKEATIRSNVMGALNLADCCWQRGVHCTMFATGCIYTYNDTHPIRGGPGAGFTESDAPNFTGSFYSVTKAYTESLLRNYANVLVLRLRMPVSDDLHPRSFVTKITKYERVVDVPNSNTILTDLLPCAVTLAEHNEAGVYNFTNPGAISHNEVLSLFEEIVRPGFRWKNFTLEEQAGVIKAGRSNCELDTGKLERKLGEYGMKLEEVHGAYRKCFGRMAEGMRVVKGQAVEGKENELPSAVQGRQLQA